MIMKNPIWFKIHSIAVYFNNDDVTFLKYVYWFCYSNSNNLSNLFWDLLLHFLPQSKFVWVLRKKYTDVLKKQ